MRIYLPHLNYTLKVKKFKVCAEMPNALAWVEHTDSNTCTLYLDKKYTPGDLAHELVHVLQFIALDRNLRFELEQEHFGYMMQYFMGEILGYEWKTT